MSKEVLLKAQKYADDIKNRMQSAVPPKHQANPAPYKAFLERELAAANRKIEALKK